MRFKDDESWFAHLQQHPEFGEKIQSWYVYWTNSEEFTLFRSVLNGSALAISKYMVNNGYILNVYDFHSIMDYFVPVMDVVRSEHILEWTKDNATKEITAWDRLWLTAQELHKVSTNLKVGTIYKWFVLEERASVFLPNCEGEFFPPRDYPTLMTPDKDVISTLMIVRSISILNVIPRELMYLIITMYFKL